MFVRIFALSLLAVSVMAAPALAGNNDEPGWTSYLDALGINGQIDQLAEPRFYQTKQISSHDGGDDDTAVVRRRPEEVILADLQGPGCITRIWCENPTGSVRIYIDDMVHPTIMADFNDFFSGSMEVQSKRGDIWVPPLLGTSGGGAYSYVPLPYKERIIIVLETTDPSLTYQINYAEFPDGTPLASYTQEHTKDDYKFFKSWKDEWSSANFQRSKAKTESYRHSRHHFYPGKNVLLYVEDGPGVITELEFMAETVNEKQFDNMWLAIWFDGQETPGVLAPIGDFFGSSTVDAGDFDSLPLGRDGTRMWCRFPMPYREGVEIRLINGGDQILDLEYYIVSRMGDVGDQRYFVARHKSAQVKDGKPYNVASIKGEGHFAGATVSATGGSTLDFLTGDDIITVDGDSMDQLQGTGTEDFFNAGWFFSENPYSGSMAGGSYKSAADPTGFTASRGFVTDTIAFTRSFRFDLDHGEDNSAGTGMTYSSVAYWYQGAAEPPAIKNSPDFKKIKGLYEAD